MSVPQIRFAATDEQWDFVTDTDRTKFLHGSGGYGAGKSHTLAISTAYQAIANPQAFGMVVADTYGRLSRDFLPKLRKVLDDSGIDFTRTKVEIEGKKTPGWVIGPDWLNHTLLFGSLQNPSSVKGPTLAHVAAEEGTLLRRHVPGMEETTFQVLISRLRHPGGTNVLRMTGTPESLGNWTMDAGMFFRAPDRLEQVESWRRNFRVIRMRSWDNRFNPEGYVQSMVDVMTPTQIKEKIEGIPAAGVAGAAYPEFRIEFNVAPVEYSPFNGPIFVGLDFNVNPMSALLGQERAGVLQFFDEISLPHSRTAPTAQELRRRISLLRGADIGQVRLYPDASGRSRKTSGETDWTILKQEGFHRLIAPRKNGLVSDRLNCVNAALYHRRILINPRCRVLIRDLTQVSVNDYGEIVKVNSELSHMSDAMGYVVVHRLPLRGRGAGLVRAA